MHVQKLIEHLNSYLPLSKEEQDEVVDRSTLHQLKRRQFLLAPGEICKHYNFVVAGALKMYKVDDAAKEHNLVFAIENEWIVDIGSFHDNKPSQLYIEAIEPSHVVRIAKPDLLHFYTHFEKFNRTFRVIIEDQYVELQKRLLQTISTTAEERYVQFMKNYPHLINRLPSTQIASYLGITPEFLSRIRSQMAGK